MNLKPDFFISVFGLGDDLIKLGPVVLPLAAFNGGPAVAGREITWGGGGIAELDFRTVEEGGGDGMGLAKPQAQNRGRRQKGNQK